MMSLPMSRWVSFHFEGHEYMLAPRPVPGFEAVGEVQAARVLAAARRGGPHAAAAALLDEHGEWCRRVMTSTSPLEPAMWSLLRRCDPHLGDPPHERAPLLSELAPPPPVETAWIEVLVVDEDDEPVAGQAYEIRLSDGRLRRARTNEHGILRYEALPEGTCEVTLVALDQSAWQAA
jgi:hypothetical protein